MALISGLENLALLVLRIIIGIIFLYHGFLKLKNPKGMAQGMGKPNMVWFVMLLGIGEFLSGIALVIGLLTQVAAVILAIIMIGAIAMKTITWKVPFSAMDKMGWEFDLVLLGAAIALMALGAGTISADMLLGLA